MTKEKAIEILKGAIKKPNTKDGYLGQALDMAIKALEQQPCEDCKVKKEAYIQGYDYGVKDWFKSKSQPCEDAISREDAKNLFWDGTEGYDCRGFTRMEIGEMLDDLPSVKPQRPSGKWVNNIHDIPICDQCGYMTPYDRAIDDYEYGNFCPNCGADMRGVIRNDE